ncbi:MAG: CHAP domain-containing protein [Anaerolineae bacterium]|nr:CHAP domain-containing protein [Anaerolineae bacterium]
MSTWLSRTAREEERTVLKEGYQKVTRALSVVMFSLNLLLVQPVGITRVAESVQTAPMEARTEATTATAPAVGVEIPERNPYSDRRQCTYRAWELAAEAGHRLPKFGNARNWRQGAIDAGYTVVDELTPECVDSVAVWQSGVGGASWAGHVAWVTEVRGDEFHIKERNWSWGRDTERWVKWQRGISFIVFREEQPPVPPEQPAPPPAPAPDPSPQIIATLRLDGQALALRGLVPTQDWIGRWDPLPVAGSRT